MKMFGIPYLIIPCILGKSKIYKVHLTFMGLDDFIDTSYLSDVLVIGGGLGGCMAAIEASYSSDVLLAVNGKIGGSGCTPLAGGPGGADFMVDSGSISTYLGLDELGPEKPDLRDSMELFKEDILEEGGYINNQGMVDVYVSLAPRVMAELMDMGLKIQGITSAHGSRFPRGVIALHSDISETMRSNVELRPIDVLEDLRITELLTHDGRCIGGIGIKVMTGETVLIQTKAVVIATGGWQMAYHTGGSDELTGDGQAMALRAGAELMDMEMSTFMDRYLIWPPIASKDNFIWDWEEKRKIVNIHGDEIKEVNGWMEKAQLISKEIAHDRCTERMGLYLKNPDNVIQNGYMEMKNFLEEWRHHDTDFEVTIGCHYCNGGIRVNEMTESKIKGLYAAGEASGGLFGARRVASALMEAAVQGKMAGINASEYANTQKNRKPMEGEVKQIIIELEKPLTGNGGIGITKLIKRIRKLSSRYLTLYRESKGLKEAINEFTKIRRDKLPLLACESDTRKFNKEWMDCISIGNILTCLEASARSALMREETRGFHRRADYPKRDDHKWLKNIKITAMGEKLTLEAIPVTVTSDILP
jgi:succinate dehydrogenase/fumarate reductase flavoprotein subunit